jgi:vacuolar iron transporter family protein
MIFTKEYVSEFVYGSTDGIITSLAVVSASLGANLSPAIMIIIGLANILADGFSMGISRYLSANAEIEVTGKTNNKPITSGFATTIAFILLGSSVILPIICFYLFNFPSGKLLYTSVFIITALALFSIGSLKSRFTKKSPLQSGFNTLLIGGIGSIIAYSVGFLLKNLTK